MILPETFELTRHLQEAGVRYWLMGGNAVELVVNRDLRGHDDVDFFVAQEDGPRALEVLEDLGFTHYHGSLEAGDVFYQRAGLLVDVVPLDVAHDPPVAVGKLTGLALPAGFLAPFIVQHEGQAIVTLRPEMHLAMKDSVAAFFSLEPREKDEIDMAALRDMLAIA